MVRYHRIAVVALVLVLAVLTVALFGDEREPTVTRVSPTGAIAVDAPITKKERFTLGGVEHHWRFRFDLPNGESHSVPVTNLDFGRYDEGDWVQLHCEIGVPCVVNP